MAGYTSGATMDYHHEGRNSNKYHHGHATSPNNYSNSGNGAASPRMGFQQDHSNEARSSRSMRSRGLDGGDSRRRLHHGGHSQRSASKSRTSKPLSRTVYSTPHTPSGTAHVPQDAYGSNNHNQHHHFDGHQSQGPMTHYDNVHAHAQNPNAVTPTNPPDGHSHAVSQPQVSASYSQGSSHSRRPAYLLHRDLVIGKGSYGQVCIASRGETEGQHSGSGKRKKFACKCVVLRNDAKYIAKLQEEVNVLRELRGHENVIRLYDVFCVDNELFIITELGRGGDLFHLLTTHPKHGVTEAYAGKCEYGNGGFDITTFQIYLLGNPSYCYSVLKRKLWHKCFQQLRSFIRDTFATEILNWKIGYLNLEKMFGVH